MVRRQSARRFASSAASDLRLLRGRDRTPPVGGQHEVVHGAGRQRLDRPQWMVGGGGAQPRLVGHLRGGVKLAPRADERIAAPQMQAEPRCPQPVMHDVEPQRHLGQLDGRAVEVDAITVVQRDIGLDPLQLHRVLVGVDAHAQLGLAAAQIFGGDLVDRLVEEGARPEGRLADRPLQQVARGGDGVVLIEAILQCQLHRHLSQRLRGVVGGARLPVTPGEAIDKRTGLHNAPVRARPSPHRTE